MDLKQYLGEIEKRLNRYFDIEKNFNYCGVTYDIFAKSMIKNLRYIASKRVTIYSFENYEYCFIKYFSNLNEEILKNYLEVLKKSVEEYVQPHDDHMNSIITGVLIIDKSPHVNIIKKIKKFKYYKSFFFGFKGWVYIRLILFDISSGKMTSNHRGKEVEKFYQYY